MGTGPLTNAGFGLGSNIGDKAGNIARALELLEQRGIVRVTAVSSIYRTAPWGYVEQDFFANACAIGETRLRPLEILAATNAVEIDMGRKPSVRWGPRLIDIDIFSTAMLVRACPIEFAAQGPSTARSFWCPRPRSRLTSPLRAFHRKSRRVFRRRANRKMGRERRAWLNHEIISEQFSRRGCEDYRGRERDGS